VCALEALPARRGLSDAERAQADAAFLTQAEALGIDPDLLIAFAPPAAPDSDQPPPPSLTSSNPGESHA
jgi:hypothetical protein